MSENYTARLAKVREAIDRIMSGSQSWRINDRHFTKADLGELHRMERYYAKLARREQRAGRNRIRYIGF
ncbi:hypothetical protein [Chromohalobacter israelensis]|uniref:hypothetical protein n=1 Tax=Chromohalobacter israelensis TaxID=141390 RepID=UPI000FFEF8E7|nr:hypothetical protein [Chromohalobacter salexigens]RXE48711.1 hypothetical protein B4O83_12330 [Chromohalobacter salexigens]